MTGDQIRVELARRKMTRVELAQHLGFTYDYTCKIISGYRNAPGRRAQITKYLKKNQQINKGLRGIS